tara:strand:- start:98 stop:496 length:399 start_codon:yes stop_codon:yes gene_type:complete
MKTINQTIKFKAKPSEVYEALMDSKKHSEFTGDEAEISKEVGGKIKAYGDYIEGENLELIENKKIVQKWRTSEWEEGKFSKVIFEFEETEEGTELKFTHEDVPDDSYEDLKQGWEDYYWEPLKEYLEREVKG